jgi:Ca2+-binding RTX toxin-like protein
MPIEKLGTVYTLTSGADVFTGTSDGDIVFSGENGFNFNDEVDGGAGEDTIVLQDLNPTTRQYYVALAKFESIENIHGADTNDDISIIADYFRSLKVIDGKGGSDNRLYVKGSSVDLRKTSFANISIILDTAGATVQSNSYAQLVGAKIQTQDTGASVIVYEHLDAAEVLWLQQRKFTDITGNNGNWKRSAPDVINAEDTSVTLANRPVLIDKGGDNLVTRFDDIGGTPKKLDISTYDIWNPENRVLGLNTDGTGISLSQGLFDQSEVRVDGSLIGKIVRLHQSQVYRIQVWFDEVVTDRQIEKLLKAVTFNYIGSAESWEDDIEIDIELSDQYDLKSLHTAIIEKGFAPHSVALSSTRISENAGKGAAIGTLSAEDANSSESHSFSIKDPASSPFALSDDGTRLVLADQSKIDFETTPGQKIRVSIVATDPLGLTAESDFDIEIADGNDAPENVILEESSVAENSAGGTTVGSIVVADPNLDDEHTFTLVDDAGGRFDIANGTIIVKNPSLLDFETASSHVVKLRATDAGELSVDREIIIGVTDANDVPVAITVVGDTVTEFSANGTFVGKLATIDQDRNDTFTYDLVDSAGGRFEIRGDEIVVANGSALDFEAQSSHTVRVRATDAGKMSVERELVIKLTDIGLSNRSVNEFSASGAVVGRLSLSNADPSKTYAYELLENAGGRFRLSGDQIMVANGIGLDFEQNAAHAVKVRVTDGAGQISTADVAINIKDVNPEKVTGTASAEIIKGGKGNDVIKGNAGNDTLYGGDGKDTLSGDLGKDVFVFGTKPNKTKNVDKFLGYKAKDDAIWLDNAVFTKLGKGTLDKPVKLAKKMFFEGSAAHDADDRIIYDAAKGALFYDADGTGSKGAVQFASISKKLKMSAEFFVV